MIVNFGDEIIHEPTGFRWRVIDTTIAQRDLTPLAKLRNLETDEIIFRASNDLKYFVKVTPK